MLLYYSTIIIHYTIHTDTVQVLVQTLQSFATCSCFFHQIKSSVLTQHFYSLFTGGSVEKRRDLYLFQSQKMNQAPRDFLSAFLWCILSPLPFCPSITSLMNIWESLNLRLTVFTRVLLSWDVEAGCMSSTTATQAQRLGGYLCIFHRNMCQAAGWDIACSSSALCVSRSPSACLLVVLCLHILFQPPPDVIKFPYEAAKKTFPPVFLFPKVASM